MQALHPELEVHAGESVLNDGELITNSGHWIHLGLELIARYTNKKIIQQIGRYFYIDTSRWEQGCSNVITPRFNHGDTGVMNAQNYIQKHYSEAISIKTLARQACISERTFIRHFTKATGCKPTDYIQRIRIQQACELMEATHQSIEVIARNVGYENSGAFRRIFRRLVGLNPPGFVKA